MGGPYMVLSTGGALSPSISFAIWFHRTAKSVNFFLTSGSAVPAANSIQRRARMRHSFGSPGIAYLHLRRWAANVVQCLFAQDIGIAFTGFCKIEDFRGDGLFDSVVTVSNPQSDADHFEGNAEDALILWVEPCAVEEWGDRHGALLLTGGSTTELSATDA
jgi:hypothetical protein